MTTTLSNFEFNLLRDYIEKSCGIALGQEKAYLIDARLSKLLAETGAKGYGEFCQLAQNDPTHKLRDRIIDAITTNETLWFRDTHPFTILREKLLPQFEAQIVAGRKAPIRIWSAACSTGQEAYSVAMTIHEFHRSGRLLGPQHFQIVGTDISSSALFLARNAKYDRLSISRGLDDTLKQRYFQPAGNVWAANDCLRKMVLFSRFNLQDSPAALGQFDVIFLRYVAIYFSDVFKRQLFSSMASALTQDGTLLLGAVESTRGYSNAFQPLAHGGGQYYRLADTAK